MTVVAVVVAAGSGTRLRQDDAVDLPKQFIDLGGKPVLKRTVEALQRHPLVSSTVIVIHPDFTPLVLEMLSDLTGWIAVAGGSDRQSSVLQGLHALEEAMPEKVIIHDAARPFLDANTITRVVEAIEPGIGAIAAKQVVDTLKRERDGFESETVDRSHVWRAQTPQGFMFQEIYKAHKHWEGENFTDDASVARAAGLKVRLVEGNEENFKITLPTDLSRAKKVVEEQMVEGRTGFGYDVHQITSEKPSTILCGVEIECGFGLVGHSDADVAMHALTDAILGSMADGDIGDHFPPSDAMWKGARSEVFLRHACNRLQERGGHIVNIDLTIICEQPKIGPLRQTMRERLSEILNLQMERISVKATTTEKLGFTGRGEGIAAHAVATVKLPGEIG